MADRVVGLRFVRQAPTVAQVQTGRSSTPADRKVLVVVQQGPGSASAVLDPGGELGRAVGMPVPRDGGRPVGYAVIDSSRRVRYATLDPSWPANGFEVGTISRAVS